MPFDELAARRVVAAVQQQAEAEALAGASGNVLVTVKTVHAPECACACPVETRQRGFELRTTVESDLWEDCECRDCLIEAKLAVQQSDEAARRRRLDGLCAP